MSTLTGSVSVSHFLMIRIIQKYGRTASTPLAKAMQANRGVGHEFLSLLFATRTKAQELSTPTRRQSCKAKLVHRLRPSTPLSHSPEIAKTLRKECFCLWWAIEESNL